MRDGRRGTEKGGKPGHGVIDADVGMTRLDG
jgi:hypothetical protein